MGIVVSCVRGWAIAHVAWVRQLDNLESGLAELRTEQLEGLAELRTLQRAAASHLDALHRRVAELEARVSWLHQRLAARAANFESRLQTAESGRSRFAADVDELHYGLGGLGRRIDALHIRVAAEQSGLLEP